MSFYGFARVVVTSFFRTAFRVQVEGTENIPSETNFVLCANHQSNLDPPLLGTCFPMRLRYMAKEELFHNKLFAKLIRSLGAFPIKRGKSDVGALRAAVKMLRNGESMVIFPEGGRSHKGYMRRGKQGAALIAAKAGVNILPVGIQGRYRLFGRLNVRIGKPIILEEYFGKKLESSVLQEITDQTIMPAIAELAGVKTYENRSS
ncbi:lysophospholipid acyltransferase family protein [Ructibacterium gallinarum]|uniref:1-acyl-sn-glycerol-3-phosphate acyltransferase n=1 Tax=Ructibacterium gallinarum TaxID=2779355 RepID=A0A9D5R9E4_9FIRM|nr:lysophospholipid acyltransferase family protein [Ructibacterium gallinarum]MBE5040404.1 1-acyl-sn-glycerol-3-phosphate acyltransferase [Ructibacterium gallinarum]